MMKSQEADLIQGWGKAKNNFNCKINIPAAPGISKSKILLLPTEKSEKNFLS